ncbi:MAG: sulfotransferase domain-containing protein [Deltaproteobacteria bacterium]|nr:sulfotransferase domain-containing protein [Deltaproteobacteria bacterium]MBW2578785.1 sulfotransferase domain-containing protein [Deltaproteobacteria bacterium]MBW2693468.1 sulfotransferase domain-containing protein [Deltaproteobacteria bacterium]
MLGFLKRTFRKQQGEPIVVVSGLPRSGTSMLMKMLDAGGMEIMTDSERTADIDNPKGYFEYERVKDLEKESDKSYVREGRGKVLKVISFLIKDLPDDNDYRVIFMRRNLDEVLASQNKMIQRLGTEDSTAAEEAMKEAYRNDIVRTRLLCKNRPNFELVEINYKNTVEDPVATAHSVNAFVGGHLDETAMREAVDSSLYRNRSKS